jgi:1,2-diacylglycerol 3-beta-galactosyltransferase
MTSSQKKSRVLVLTADAGFGHRSAALAVQKALEMNYSDRLEVEIVNPLDHPKTPRMLKESQTDYDAIVKKLPDLYEAGFKVSDAGLPVSLMEAGLIVLMYEPLKEIISKHQPNIIITTYPLYQAPLDAINNLTNHPIPWITTITDLITVHRVWFHIGVSTCMVPTEKVQQYALKAGLKPHQVKLSGIPVNPTILDLKQSSKEAMKQKLQWSPNKTGLLVVGGTRVTALIDALEVIDHSGFDLELILVAGGNDALHQKFEDICWHHSTKIYNFVDNMPELMRGADLVACKAGGLVVTESLASGLPLLLLQALPGQEIGNAHYVEEHQAGALCKTPLAILKTLCHYLSNDQSGLVKAAQQAEKLGEPQAAFTIADEAYQFIQRLKDEQTPMQHNVEKRGLLRDLLEKFRISL